VQIQHEFDILGPGYHAEDWFRERSNKFVTPGRVRFDMGEDVLVLGSVVIGIWEERRRRNQCARKRPHASTVDL